MADARSAFVESVARRLEADAVGTRRRLGSGLLVDLRDGTLLTVGEGFIEVTVSKPHPEAAAEESLGAEDAREEAILEAFRQGLGARLAERGWTEVAARTTEATLADADVVPGTVTEVVCRFETKRPQAAADEIGWLASRL